MEATQIRLSVGTVQGKNAVAPSTSWPWLPDATTKRTLGAAAMASETACEGGTVRLALTTFAPLRAA